MPVPKLYTPITPKKGGLVHVTTLKNPLKTACGRRWSGWVIAKDEVTCELCEAALESLEG